MSKNSLNVSLKGADDIFSTEESRQEQQREQVQQIPIGELFPFKNHPFKVLDDESMQRTVESVDRETGRPRRLRSARRESALRGRSSGRRLFGSWCLRASKWKGMGRTPAEGLQGAGQYKA